MTWKGRVMQQNPLVTLNLGGMSTFRMQTKVKANLDPPPDRPEEVLYRPLANGNGAVAARASKKRRSRASASK